MAQIINISLVQPERTDKYFFDTNVWFWFTYCGANFISSNKPRAYQLENYPLFIEKIQNIGAKIFHCPLIYTELANLIERTEYEEYLKVNNLDRNVFTRKKFRENELARAKVIREIESAWSTISRFSECLELTLNSSTIQATHSFMKQSKLDPYDAIFIHFMNSHNIKMLVSDDADMMTSNIEQIFTANNRFIS